MLSNTVASAFAYYGSPETKETERFVRTFDRFFDMMNTRCLEEEIQKKKPDLKPFEKDDPRFEVHIIIFVILYNCICACCAVA